MEPHITLAARDLGLDRVGTVIRWLAASDLTPWAGRITRLGLIVDDNGHHDPPAGHRRRSRRPPQARE